MLKPNKTFLILTLVILLIEIGIATFVKSGFIRFTLGDVLASILVYTSIRCFTNLNPKIVALISVFISFLIEGLQYIHFTKLIHLEHSKIVNIVLGTHFCVEDLIAYTIGILIIYYIDKNHIHENTY